MNTPNVGPGTEKKPFPWLVFGVPIGCGIGTALRNLPMGVAIGVLIGGVASAVQARRSGKKISPVIYVAFGVSALGISAVVFLRK